MPQLDKLAYINEFFVLLLAVIVMYFLLAYVVLPIIFRNIFIRNYMVWFYQFPGKSFYGITVMHSLFHKRFNLSDLAANLRIDSALCLLTHRIYNFTSPLSWITGWRHNIMHFYFVAFEKETHYGWVRPFFDVDRKLRRKVKKFRLLWKNLLVSYILILTLKQWA